MTTATEFLDQTEINGRLTPQQAAELMALTEQGDTSTKLDNGGAPATTPDADNQTDDNGANESNDGARAPATTGDAVDPAKTKVLAKDGIHTIPYEKLEQARQGEQHWKAQAEANAAELESLRAQAQARADAGAAPTAQDNKVAVADAAIDAGVDPAIFGDFSEEDLAKGIQTLVAKQGESINAAVEKRLQEMLAPMLKQQAASATDTHYGAIYEHHPDADSVAESKELDEWIKSQPSYAQPAMRGVLDGGTTAQVIELFDSFKKATGQGSTQNAADPNKSAAKAAISAAQRLAPMSLSDIPGGKVEGVSAYERLANQGAPEMAQSMAGMTPEQIEAFLNRTS